MRHGGGGQRSRRATPWSFVVVTVSVIAAFALRVWLPFRAVFGQDYVAFTETDAWYHMRLVDGLVARFPWRIWHDGYLIHPAGESVNVAPLFDWLIAGTALVLGGGSPSPRLVDLVGAFAPAVIGALTILPVFLLTKTVFSPRAARWSSVCAAVVGGDFFLRSSLGFTDHHCAEVLFTTFVLWFAAKGYETKLVASARRSACLAGLTLGAYLLTWGGGSLFVVMLVGWACIEVLVAHAAGRDGRSAVSFTIWSLGIAAVMIAPWLATRPTFGYGVLALCLGMGAVTAVDRALHLGTRRGYTVSTLIALLGVFGFAAIAIVVLVIRVEVPDLIWQVARFSPWRNTMSVAEAAPLIRSASWRPFPLWNQYGTSLLLAGVALLLHIGPILRSPRGRLLMMWGAVSLVATFGQVRFSYYLAVPVIVLAGHGAETLLAGVRRLVRRTLAVQLPQTALAACLVPAIVISSVGPFAQVSTSPGSISPDWFDALMWLRTNTPEPFADADAYLDGGQTRSAYGVMNWWDWGYLVTRIARRVPIANPKQSGLDEALTFYLADTPKAARAALTQSGARYILVDALLQVSTGRRADEPGYFAALADAAGKRWNDYCEALTPASGAAQPLIYCYPAYYQAAAVRLYAFGGRAVQPDTVHVIDIDRSRAAPYPRIRNEWTFQTYDEAVQFTRLRPPGTLRIASQDPRSTCVPLETFEGLIPVYQSVGRQRGSRGAPGPSLVQIYEYRPPAVESAGS